MVAVTTMKSPLALADYPEQPLALVDTRRSPVALAYYAASARWPPRVLNPQSRWPW